MSVYLFLGFGGYFGFANEYVGADGVVMGTRVSDDILSMQFM